MKITSLRRAALALLTLFPAQTFGVQRDGSKEGGQVLYVAMVYEPGPTLREARDSYWRDYKAFENMCRAQGGDRLRIVEDHAPVYNGDGFWNVQAHACIVSPQYLI
jgi:hypothetical protein